MKHRGMRVVMILHLLLFSLTSISQSIEKDKVDDFTGARTVMTKNEDIGVSDFLRVLVFGVAAKDKTSADTSLVAYFIFKCSKVTSVSEESIAYFKFTDGVVMKFNHSGNYKIYNSNDLVIINFDVNNAFFEKLKMNNIEKVRLSTSSETIDIEVEVSKKDMLFKMIELVKNTLKKSA